MVGCAGRTQRQQPGTARALFQMSCRGGAAQFVDHLSGELQRLGGQLRVRAPVSDIFQGPRGVTVLTHNPDEE